MPFFKYKGQIYDRGTGRVGQDVQLTEDDSTQGGASALAREMDKGDNHEKSTHGGVQGSKV
jgi:hypothetical protein